MTINKISSRTAFNPKNLAKFLLLISINPYNFIIKIRMKNSLEKHYELRKPKITNSNEFQKNKKIIKKLFKESIIH